MISPSPESTPMREVLAAHYRTHGLPSDGGVSDPWFYVRIGPVTLRLPNPPARKRAVVLHDINHVVTDYNTTFGEGEMDIAAFEVGAGCGSYGIVWFINLTMFALGLLSRPRSVLHAFVRGRRSASIYHDARSGDALAAMSVTDVRSLLRVDQVPGMATVLERVRAAGWGALAILVLIAPVAVVALALIAAVRLIA